MLDGPNQRVMQDKIPKNAGAPDWLNTLLADEAAMDRMAYRLLAEISLETGTIHLGGPWDARQVVREVLEASVAPKEKPPSPARPA